MPTYLILTKEFANADAAFEAFDLDESASPAEINAKLVEFVGGELIDMYYTGGEYKAALVIEFPDQQTMIHAQKQAQELGLEEMLVLDAVHYADMPELVAN